MMMFSWHIVQLTKNKLDMIVTKLSDDSNQVRLSIKASQLMIEWLQTTNLYVCFGDFAKIEQALVLCSNEEDEVSEFPIGTN